jgi:hypothetical protein
MEVGISRVQHWLRKMGEPQPAVLACIESYKMKPRARCDLDHGFCLP